MGSYRLILSVLVLLSHAGVWIFGINQGVVAVISFFLLSGFVMAALIRRYYLDVLLVGDFYADRILRLFPQYIFYLTATLIFVGVTGFHSPQVEGLTAFKVVLNYLMLPLSFYMYGLNDAMPIPQAWSLGLELTFYLLIPFILIWRLEVKSFIFSVMVFAFAYFGVIPAHFFGYRLLPGVLFIFLVGCFVFDRRKKFLWLTFLMALIAFFAVLLDRTLQRPYNFEVLLGVLIGLPVVVVLNRSNFGKMDEFLGNISYGVFLNHFLLIWVFEYFGVGIDAPFYVAGLVLASVALAWVSFSLIEQPVLKYRRALRKKEA